MSFYGGADGAAKWFFTSSQWEQQRCLIEEINADDQKLDNASREDFPKLLYRITYRTYVVQQKKLSLVWGSCEKWTAAESHVSTKYRSSP